MQDETIKSYNENYEKYLSKAVQVASKEYIDILDFFAMSLKGNKKVIEIGSGSLRDALYFRKLGIEFFCTDIADLALKLAEENNFEFSYYDFRDSPKVDWINTYDGVFSSAVLLHASPLQFKDSLKNIFSILKKEGVFFLALKGGSGEKIETEKLGAPRYFKFWKKDEVEQIAKETGFEPLKYGELADGSWIYFVFKK